MAYPNPGTAHSPTPVKKQFQADFAWTCEWIRINKQVIQKNFLIDRNGGLVKFF